MVSALRSGLVRAKAGKASTVEHEDSNTATKKRTKKRKEDNSEKPVTEAATTKAPEQSAEEADKKSMGRPPVKKTIEKTRRRKFAKAKSAKAKRGIAKNIPKGAQASNPDASTLKPREPMAAIEKSIVESAVRALMKDYRRKHHGANENSTAPSTVRFIDDVARVSLVFSLKVPPSKSRFKPKRIQLKHSMYDEQSEICMFVKDPVDMVTRVFDKSGYGGVTRVMGISELKTDFNTHERRRTLASTYDLFLCDSRVIPSMPKLLGNFFSKTKKMPLEVDLNRKLPDVIERAVKSTSLHMPHGTCTTVHIGNTDLSTEQLVDNANEAMARVFTVVENGIDNVLSVHMKTTKSQSLPLYVSLPTLVNITPKPKVDDEDFTIEDLYRDKHADAVISSEQKK